MLLIQQLTLTELTTRSLVFSEKLPVTELLNNLPTFYGTQTLITVFAKALY
jgi:hypothetical protein